MCDELTAADDAALLSRRDIGVLVAGAIAGSPAAEAGLRAGDIVVGLRIVGAVEEEGVDVAEVDEARGRQEVRDHDPGQPLGQPGRAVGGRVLVEHHT